jgi:signal transduction histidine kinase
VLTSDPAPVERDARVIPVTGTTVVGVTRPAPPRPGRSPLPRARDLGRTLARHLSPVPGPWRPDASDLALVTVCVLLMFVEIAVSEHAAVSGWGTVAVLVTASPVLIRRWAPVLALLLAFAGLFAVIESPDGPYNAMPASAVICAYTVAVRFGRRVAVVTAAASLPATLWILQTFSPHALLSWGTAQNLSLVVLPLALGVAAHDRRAATAALVERAEAAERSRDEEALRRVGEERLRIARDVHDVVAHAMVTINVQAGVGAYLLREDPDQAHAALRTIKQLSGDALSDLRQVLGLLRADPVVVPVGRLAELDALGETLRAAGVGLDLDLDPAARALPVGTDATAYRIVQEALTNTLRHAGPTRARVRVALDPTSVLVEIEDDGPPVAPDPPPAAAADAVRATGSGNGLRGMRERAAAAGGALEAGPRAEGGWRVTARLPLDQAHPEAQAS